MGRIITWRIASEVADLLLLGLLGEEHGLDVREDTTLGNGNTREELVQLLVIANGKLEVTGDDPGLLVVPGSVTGQLEDLSREVFHDGSHVDGGTSSHTLGVVSFAKKTVDSSYWELKSSPGGSALCLSLCFSRRFSPCLSS